MTGLPPLSPIADDGNEGQNDETDTKGDRFMTMTVLALANAQSGDAPKSKGFAALLRDAMETQRGTNTLAAHTGGSVPVEATATEVDSAVSGLIAELGADESQALA